MPGPSTRPSQPSKTSWTYRFPDESFPKGRNLLMVPDYKVSAKKSEVAKLYVPPDYSRNGNNPNKNPKLNKLGRTWDEWVQSIGCRNDSIESIKHTIDNKIQDHKIFTIVGLFGFLRAELHLRGWVERPHAWTYSKLPSEQPEKPETYHEAILKSKIMDRLSKCKPDFLWNYKQMCFTDWKQISSKQLINRLPMPNFRDAFTSKAGIITCIRNAYWHEEPKVSHVLSPRSYRMYEAEEVNAFVSDYGVTACIGILRWLVHRCDKDSVEALVSNSPKFGLFSILFALEKLDLYLKTREHEDLERTFVISDRQWAQFFRDFHRAISAGDKVKLFQTKESGHELYDRCTLALDRLSCYLPQMAIDGYRNMWILKPAESSKGNGIKIFSDLNKILDVCMETRDGHFNWVVQKYIERPLLIDKTKFDIRQWFLVSKWDPLTVWFYKDSYLRFCSRPFRFDDFHESIHLCNYAVQVKYARPESAQVLEAFQPEVWSSTTFKQYLSDMKKEYLWESSIYPKMKEAVIAILLSAKQIYAEKGVQTKVNAFELFGADFMLTADFVPWLIEINSLPLITTETRVMNRARISEPSKSYNELRRICIYIEIRALVMKELCGNCLTDCIKVILDRRENPTANTGNFELIHQEIPSPHTDDSIEDVVLEGTPCFFVNARENNGNNNYLKPTATSTTHELSQQFNSISNKVSLIPMLSSSGRLNSLQDGGGRLKFQFSVKPKHMSPKSTLFKNMNRLDTRLALYSRSGSLDTSKKYFLGRTGLK